MSKSTSATLRYLSRPFGWQGRVPRRRVRQAVINWEDLESGRYGEWAGNLLPDTVLAVTTGGAGTVATRSARISKATSKLADGARAFNRATDLKASMPVRDYRVIKTFAAQPGDGGRISISGETFDDHRRMLDRVGVDSSLLKTQDSAHMRQALNDAGHTMPGHRIDGAQGQPRGWYYGTHAEIRLLLDDPKVPVGVTKAPCAPSCDPGIQALANKLKEDILIHSPDGPTLYRGDGA